jgi:hypothetical protein
MGFTVFNQIIKILIVLFVQVTFLNSINLHQTLNPYIYPLLILTFPFSYSTSTLVVLGFLIGSTVDIFSHTPGLHASATVLLAFLRNPIVGVMLPRSGYETDSNANILGFGLSWVLSYLGVCIFIHHLSLYFLEIFTFSHFFSTLFKSITSSLFSISVILLYLYLFSAKKKGN